MSRLHQNLRISLSIVMALIGVSHSGMAWAVQCAANQSPTEDCTNLFLESESGNLNINIPSGIVIDTTAWTPVENRGSNNLLTNDGTLSVVSSGVNFGLENRGVNFNLINNGLVTASSHGIYNTSASFGIINNLGTISGGYIGILNDSYAQINSIYNSGVIISDSGIGIRNDGTIDALNNGRSGVIIGAESAFYNDSAGQIQNLSNNGGRLATGSTGFAIYNERGAIIDLLSNSGTIDVLDNNPHAGLYARIYNKGTVGTIDNASLGFIKGSEYGILNGSNASIDLINNSGNFQSVVAEVFNDRYGFVGTVSNSGYLGNGESITSIYNDGEIESIFNAGYIRSGYGILNDQNGLIKEINNIGAIVGNIQAGVYNRGVINSLNNSQLGQIRGVDYGVLNVDTIEIVTNYGTVYGELYGIYNSGYITTINNYQGNNNANGALSLGGYLPAKYNIILGDSPQAYGSLRYLSGSGALASFGIYAGLVKSKIYSNVLSGITDVNNGTSGKYGGFNYQLALQAGSTDVWDLLFPSYLMATNSLTAVQQIASGMSSLYNQQTAAYQAALSYDCQLYDTNNLCVSVGGRYTYAGPTPSANQQAGLVILGYKPVPTFRMGAFADQSVNNTTPTGITQSKSSPMWGLFAKWHMNKDETGLGVQASAVTSASKLTTTRAQFTDTETGSGSTQFNGQGYQLTTNYHHPVTNNTSLVPYLGLRYTRINAGAYTENTTATVTSPLSYNAMAQNTFSAIGGIGVRSHLAEKLIGTASAGIQQNLNYSMGSYAGTSSISGLETFSVKMPGNVNSMATASAGLYYDIRKNERVGLNVLWQQQPFIETNTTTALATYTIGF